MGLGKKTIDDQNYCGKKVLVRCDFNVPMKDGVITIVDQLLDGGQSRMDAVLVGDHTVLHRDVEIATDKHLLAAVVLIVDRLLT